MSPALTERSAVARLVSAGLTLAAGVMMAAPASAFAQAAGTETGPPPAWRFQVTAAGAWYENAYFVADASTSWSASGTASLTRQKGFRRGSYSLSGYGGTIYYPEIDSFNQATYGGSLAIDWAPSPRTQVRLGQTYHRSNTRQLPELDREALPLPTSGLDAASSSIGLSHNLDRGWQVGLNGGFNWRRYDDEALLGGEQLGVNLSLGHQLGRTGSAYFSYGYSSSWYADRRTGVLQAVLGGRKEVDKGVSFDLGAGVAYVQSTRATYPTGYAGLSAHARRSSLTLGYRRDFGQAWGYGREMIADLAYASLGWTPARRLSFSAGYSFGYRRDTQDLDYRIRSHVGRAGFGWEIAKDLSFGAQYYREWNETAGLEPIEGGRATASLSYGVSWK